MLHGSMTIILWSIVFRILFLWTLYYPGIIIIINRYAFGWEISISIVNSVYNIWK